MDERFLKAKVTAGVTTNERRPQYHCGIGAILFLDDQRKNGVGKKVKLFYNFFVTYLKLLRLIDEITERNTRQKSPSF